MVSTSGGKVAANGVWVQAELMPEAWGGNTPFCEISAKQGQGITELLGDPAAREDMAQRARRAVESHTWEARAQRILAFMSQESQGAPTLP